MFDSVATTRSASLSRRASDFCREQPDEAASTTSSRTTALLAFLCISKQQDPPARSRFCQHSAHKHMRMFGGFESRFCQSSGRLTNATERKHRGLQEVHRRLGHPGAAESADFVQRAEEWIVSIKGGGRFAGPAASERQRRSDSKPRVGATRLPWVKRPESSQPQRGCDLTAYGRNPVGVELTCTIRTQGSLRQPWAGGRNAVGVPASSDIFCPPLRGHQRLIIRRLLEGDMKIGHPFKGGIVEAENRVPKGRLNSCHRDGNMNTRTTFAGFNRPFGTFPTANPNPAVNCRAIVKSPFGRGEA